MYVCLSTNFSCKEILLREAPRVVAVPRESLVGVVHQLNWFYVFYHERSYMFTGIEKRWCNLWRSWCGNISLNNITISNKYQHLWISVCIWHLEILYWNISIPRILKFCTSQNQVFSPAITLLRFRIGFFWLTNQKSIHLTAIKQKLQINHHLSRRFPGGNCLREWCMAGCCYIRTLP